MPAATLWRHAHPTVVCPDADRLLTTRQTGRYRSAPACKRCRDWLEKIENDKRTFTEDSLTDFDRACGVTLEQVKAVAPRTLFRDDLAVFPPGTAPALATAILRGIDGAFDFSHLLNGAPVYRRR